MKPISGLGYFVLSAFSNPASNRIIYRTIRRSRIASIVEIGVGDAERAANMIRVAKKYSGSGSVRYTGIDLFEADLQSPITLKECHRKLGGLDVKLQLVPGDVASGVNRIANSHLRTDLVVISGSNNTAALDDIWFLVPRMLHATSVVFLQESGDEEGYLERLGRLEIERKVRQTPRAGTKAA